MRVFQQGVGGGASVEELIFQNVKSNTPENYESIAKMPIGLSGMTCQLIGDLIYVFGGRNPDYSNNSKVYIYDIVSNTWTDFDCPYVLGAFCFSVKFEDIIYLTYQSNPHKLLEFHTSDRQWIDRGAIPSVGVFTDCIARTTSNDSIYIYVSNISSSKGAIYKCDRQSFAWTLLVSSTTLYINGDSANCNNIDDYIVFAGGGGGTATGVVFTLNPDNTIKTGRNNSSHGDYPVLVSRKGYIEMFGGKTDRSIHNTYDFRTDTYTTKMNIPTVKSQATGCLTLDDKIFLIGGIIASETPTDISYRYTKDEPIKTFIYADEAKAAFDKEVKHNGITIPGNTEFDTSGLNKLSTIEFTNDNTSGSIKKQVKKTTTTIELS